MAQSISRTFGKDWVFWLIVGLFVTQALWIAFSSAYPMAFDEDFHFGIIKLYAHRINPFWQSHPAGADAFGAVTRDPSYLYHYLMSFPYRLISWVSGSVYVQVMFLRMLNIGMLASSLLLFKRLLVKLKLSSQIVNLSLLVFVLLPITPFLAAQINYDNLFIPFTALILLYVAHLISGMQYRQIRLDELLTYLSLSLAACLIKYAFLPIFLATLAVLVVLNVRVSSTVNKQLWSVDLSKLKHATIIPLIILNLIVGGLFLERYGLNLLRYHRPVADCGMVLGYDHCQYYGPWKRDYTLAQKHPSTDHNPLAYTQHWLYGMWFRTYFAVAGPGNDYQTRGPLLFPGLTGVLFVSGGLISVLIYWPKMAQSLNRRLLYALIVVSCAYVFSLWLEQFRMYLHTGEPVAINGRYLLPIAPILAGLGFAGLNQLPVKLTYKVVFSILLIFCTVCGGGALTYILRSDPSWYWPNSHTMHVANKDLQTIIGPFTPGYRQPTAFLH